jgi:hypothetical protein
VGTLENLERTLNGDRNVLRRKVVVLMDLFNVDGITRRLVVSKFEAELSKLTDLQVKKILQVLRE